MITWATHSLPQLNLPLHSLPRLATTHRPHHILRSEGGAILETRNLLDHTKRTLAQHLHNLIPIGKAVRRAYRAGPRRRIYQ